MNIKYIAAVSLSCLTIATAQPISESSAKRYAIGGGAVVGLGTGFITYLAIKDTELGGGLKAFISATAGLGGGALTWYLLDSYLQTLTPAGRYQTARNIIAWIETDSLNDSSIATHSALVERINVRFGTSWPLPLARDYYMSMARNLERARNLAQQASNEAQSDPTRRYLCDSCNELKMKISDLAFIIEDRLNRVTNDPDYHFQVKAHEKFLKEERERAERERQKRLDRQHKSWEKERDRELKRREKEKDRIEKEKDRQHKDRILKKTQDRPVILNI